MMEAPHNPFAIALVVFTGFSWLVAILLWLVRSQVTDYEVYDVATAHALGSWVDILVVSGAAAAVGALTIMGVRRELRRASPDR